MDELNSDELVRRVEQETSTELERLGSEKGLTASTAGETEPETVLRTAYQAEKRALETFLDWAEAEDDPELRGNFTDVATLELDHCNRVRDLLPQGEEDPDPEPGPLHRYLRGLDGSLERIGGGLIGRPLVSDATLAQTVGFFVGHAASDRADLFRELREDNRSLLELGKELLRTRCKNEQDWAEARRGAVGAVQKAYRGYTDTLESLGINPKPVC